MHYCFKSAKLNGKETIKLKKEDTNFNKTNISTFFNFDQHVNFISLKEAFNICKTLTLEKINFL